MPVYEYRCAKCGQEIEHILLGAEREPTTCAACGGKLKRLWSRVGVRFSGWGFARTDALLPDSKNRRSFRDVQDKASELFD